MTITDAAFHSKHGTITSERGEYFWLLTCVPDANHVERPAQQTLRHIFRPQPHQIFPLSKVLFVQLAIGTQDNATIDWNVELKKRPFPSTGTDYRAFLQEAMNHGAVRAVISQQPHTIPGVLTPKGPQANPKPTARERAESSGINQLNAERDDSA